jgi:hypothetical protein
MKSRVDLSKYVLPFLLALCSSPSARSEDDYLANVQPYIQKYCVECHGKKVAKGELDLEKYAQANDVIANFRRWNNVIEFIQAGEMPPKDSPQPSIDESNALVNAVQAILITEARKQAGDPGVVLPRRLSNTEYDLSIRELTGVEINATKDFPPDPAGGEGFDNTGEALGMSPNLLKKYLAAAQMVSDHLVLKTKGISFAPYPVTSYNERTKLTEQAVIDFYERHAVNIPEYMEAAWRYRYRPADQQHQTVLQWGASNRLSPNYLELVWNALHSEAFQSGSLRELGETWNALPAPLNDKDRSDLFLAFCERLEFYRGVLTSPEGELIQANAGNWPIKHLDFRAKVAEARDKFSLENLSSEWLLKPTRISAPDAGRRDPKPASVILQIESAFPGAEENYVVVRNALFSKADRIPNGKRDEDQQEVQSLRSVLEKSLPLVAESLGFGKHPLGDQIDADSFVVKAPSTIEIPITVEMQRELDGKHLLLQCQLDPKHSREGSVYIQHAFDRDGASNRDRTVRLARGRRSPANCRLLMHRDSQSAVSLERSAAVFCSTFPNRFFYVDSGRGLAAGFHLVEGVFRDDLPLVNKVLNDSERVELDQLWNELHFVTESAETLLRGFVWFERSEREVLHDKRFDFLRAEDPQLVEDSLLDKFEKLYLDKLGVKRIGDTLEAEVADAKYTMIRGFFTGIRQGLLRHQQQLKQAEQLALEQIDQFAQRAYRRELSAQDRESLRALYSKLRTQGLDVEPALRGLLTAVLMSPDFCYLYQQPPAGPGFHPLSDQDLASRLSFFLWSTLPDDELMATAVAGQLHDQETLVKQTRRMMKDDRVSAFAREFFGQWLRYRDYLTKDPIHAEAFPGYDDELRNAIFEEPARLATYLIQHDQPITQLLNSDMTFVNRKLAKHYGDPFERQYRLQQDQSAAGDRVRSGAAPDAVSEWHPVTGLRSAGRGGLFGMAVVLTKNSAGERTSPVKRGFWSVHHLLGQHFPPPPADVAELPKSEKDAERSIRELLAIHVENQQCALCHKHFDGLGIAMEGFDAIGRKRTNDSAGRPVDSRAELPGGETAEGIPGLIEYIEKHRRDDFVRTMCRKFLGYALGRSVYLSDQPLLDEMATELQNNNYRFSTLFETVVRSPQFRQQRGRDFQVNTH